jgi:predicted transcriptional regulator
MKTAISIPDQTYQHAEQLALELGLSRSAMYTRAIEEFLERTRSNQITEQLNQVYAQTDLTPEEQAFSRVASARGLKRAQW